MLNAVTKRLATSNVPGILSSESQGIDNNYRYDHQYGNAYMTEMDKQVLFDKQLNEIVFGGTTDPRYNRLLNGDDTLDRQVKGINQVVSKPIETREKVIQNMSNQLNQTAVMNSIDSDEPLKPAKTVNPPPSKEDIQQRLDEIYSTEKFTISDMVQSNGGTILICLMIAFVFYIMIQLYISQKRIEMYIAMNQRGNGVRGGF